jgi:hypothetical protein
VGAERLSITFLLRRGDVDADEESVFGAEGIVETDGDAFGTVAFIDDADLGPNP